MVEKLHIKDNEIVVPGQLLAEGMSYIPSGKAIRNGEAITATAVGKISNKGHVVKVVPIFESYTPRRGDRIIGKITSMNNYGWALDIGVPVRIEMDLREASQSYVEVGKMNKFFKVGDLVFAEIIGENRGALKVTAKNRPHRKLAPGYLMEINQTDIPRIIGKEGSMINTLKEESGCGVVIGQNGYVWIQSDTMDSVLNVKRAIELIQIETSRSGLTEKIKKMLGGKK